MLFNIDLANIVDPEDVQDVLHRNRGWRESTLKKTVGGAEIWFKPRGSNKTHVLDLNTEKDVTTGRKIDLKKELGATNLFHLHTLDGESIILVDGMAV